MKVDPAFLAAIGRDPGWFAHKLDLANAAVLFIAMTKAQYAAASFLDDRILTPQTKGLWAPCEAVRKALAGARGAPLHFIFHAGHVGSTLISRLLDAAGGVLGLREPLPLRTLAEAHDAGAPAFAQHLETQIRLWRRAYPDTRAVILKATSSAARIAAPLMEAAPEAKALYFNLAAEPYLAVLLAGENTPIDLKGMGGERMRRLHRFIGEAPAPASLGELAALTWLAERLTQAKLVQAAGARVLCVDFDAFLARPGEAFRACAAHLGVSTDVDVEKSPLLTRYSKAPEYAYSPADRAEIMAQSRMENAAEIRRGLNWLERLGTTHAAVAALL